MLWSCPTCHRIRRTVIDIVRGSCSFSFFPLPTSVSTHILPLDCSTSLSLHASDPWHHTLPHGQPHSFVITPSSPPDVIMMHDPEPDSDPILSHNIILPWRNHYPRPWPYIRLIAIGSYHSHDGHFPYLWRTVQCYDSPWLTLLTDTYLISDNVADLSWLIPRIILVGYVICLCPTNIFTTLYKS